MELINRLSSEVKAREGRRQSEEGLLSNNSAWGPIRPGYPENYGDMTLYDIGFLEWRAIENTLRMLPSEGPRQILPSGANTASEPRAREVPSINVSAFN